MYIGRGENDKFNAEGGDDIMVGSTGLGDRYIGGSGFDWADFKNDQLGVYADLNNRFFDQPPVPGSGASALARFDIVEGLSGSAHADVLIGDNEDPTTLPGAGAQGSVLTNIGLIDGLQEFLDTALGGPVTFFDGGNIILGGAGGDLLEGRGGNDILDGDAWLNVRISVRTNVDDPSTEIDSFDSMEPMIPFMVNGIYSASQLVIVREILYASSPDFDTAIFTGNRADYTITIDDQGTVSTLDDVVTVTDTVGTDGTDTLMHIERLRFADQTVLLAGNNNAPVGTLGITGTFEQGAPLTVSIAGVTDADNLSATNLDGHIPDPVSYFWQVDLAGDGIFTDIEVVRAAEIARVEGRTFIPTEDEVGLALRVRAIYRDANGVLEEVFSTPTTPIGDVNDAPIGLPTISDTTPAEGELLTALLSGIVDPDGTTTSIFSVQWQQSDVGGGGTFTDIADGTLSTFTPGGEQVGRQLRVVVTFTDDNGNTEIVTSVPTALTSTENDSPSGLPIISDTTPTEGETLTVSTDLIADPDGTSGATFAFQWQVSTPGGAFVNIDGATAASFTPNDAQVGRQIRVITTFTDDQGHEEMVISAPTQPTANVNDAPAGAPAISDGSPTQGQLLTASTAGITDEDGIASAFSFQWQQSDVGGGGTFLDIAGATGASFTPSEAQVGRQIQVVVSYTDGHGATESVTSAPTAATSNTNEAPVGTPTVSDAAPTEGEALTASTAGITDPDGIASAFSFQWQQSGLGGAGAFSNIAGATSASFTPTEAQVDRALRVVVSYTDGHGTFEAIASGATAPTANVNGGPTGLPAISDTSPTPGLLLTALTSGIVDPDGTTTSVFAFQWQQSDLGGGGTFADIGGATAATFMPATAQANRALRVVVSYTDDNGTPETVASAATAVTGIVFAGGSGAQNFVGSEGDDQASGGAGNDTLNGLGGNDTLSGDAGKDVIRGGAGDDLITGGASNDALFGEAGNDTFNYVIGDGADAIDGGAGIDWLRIVGTAANNTLAARFDGSVLTSVAGSSLTGIELVTADLLGGIDTLNYTGTTAAVAVNLGAGTASGFGAIAGIENVTGGSGADHLTGSADANTLSGGSGDDILAGGLGNDTLTGGSGFDTASYAGETADMFVSLTSNTARRGSAAAAVEDKLSSIENILGGLGNDTLTGSKSGNILDGGAGNDTLSGAAGADALFGGAGADILIGGTGNDMLSGGADDDTFVYTIGDGIDIIDGGTGTDTLSILGTSRANTLDVIFNGASITQFEGSTITSIEAITADLLGGSDRLSYAGTTAAVTVNLAAGTASGFASIANIENATGGSGNDTFIGNDAVNSFTGGAGDDTYFLGTGDKVTESAGGGIDQVFTTASSFTLSSNVENLTYTGVGNFTGSGSSGNNVITGGAGADLLKGNGGADTLIGGEGVDSLQGGAGDDILVGGAGNDTLNGGSGNDMFVFGPGFGDDVITGGFDANAAGGQDLLDITALSITSANFADHVTITDLGSNTMVTIDGSTILLMGVNGVGTNVITIDDFHLMA